MHRHGLCQRIAEAMRNAEAELGAVDAFAGDGDHGFCMSRGSDAASKAAAAAVALGAGARSVLQRAGDAWGDRAGGASGALWGVALARLGRRLFRRRAGRRRKTSSGAQERRSMR